MKCWPVLSNVTFITRNNCSTGLFVGSRADRAAEQAAACSNRPGNPEYGAAITYGAAWCCGNGERAV